MALHDTFRQGAWERLDQLTPQPTTVSHFLTQMDVPRGLGLIFSGWDIRGLCVLIPNSVLWPFPRFGTMQRTSWSYCSEENNCARH